MANTDNRVELSPGILIKDQFLELMRAGSLRFEPALDSLQIGQVSIDLRLGFTFMVPKLSRMTARGRELFSITLDDDGVERFDTVQLEPGQEFQMAPGETITASNLERITMPVNARAIMYPRSSINRRGLSVGQTGIIDPGYEGQLLIPLTNKTPQIIHLYPGQRFCQIEFSPLSQSCELVQSRWHNSDIVVGSKPEKVGDENSLIIAGDIKGLKERYKLTFLED